MSERLTRRDHAALVQLADGTLTGARLRRAQARVRAIPDADRLIERQRRVARALGERPAPQPAAVRRPRLIAAAAVAAAVALAIALLPGGDPSPERVAAISQLQATDPAPASSGPVLREAAEGIPFPDWGSDFGWHATGTRRDDIDGRRMTTVFYEHHGHRLAYTIVSGPALKPPAHARIIVRDGLKLAVYRDPRHGGHEVAVFERNGRTCVLAGHVLHRSTLLKLAAWKGGGEIRS
jgi:hypothetical protein